MTWDIAQQVIRIALYFGGGAAVARGWTSAETVEWVSGTLMTLAALVWWQAWSGRRGGQPPEGHSP